MKKHFSIFQNALWRTGWRYLFRHPWQTGLMILGIMLGVAVVVAVDLANASAGRAFNLSAEAIAGRTTHQISGGPQGIDEKVYTTLHRQPLDVPMAPVISEYVRSPDLEMRTFQLLGVDPFAEPPFRNYLSEGGSAYGGNPSSVTGQAAIDLTTFLTRPGAIIISQDTANRYHLRQGQSITLQIAGNNRTALITGILLPQDALSRQALDGLILADIATVQELTGREGWLDRIDLILPEGQPGTRLSTQIQALLPAGVRLEPVGTRSGAVEQMTNAFRVNLSALSLLALLVGLFLIYNTITFSVVQRRTLFGTLRCLGVTREGVFTLVLGEALIVGVVGSLLGVGLGILMGQGAVRLVTQTINDLFFVLNLRGVQIPLSSLVKGFVLGAGATLMTAAPPAWEAASVPPRVALSRSGLEGKARQAISLAAIAGAALILAGWGILSIPTRSLLVSFVGTFSVLVGFALLVPTVTRWLMGASVKPLGVIWGTLGRMAPRNVIGSLSRTSIAVMALMVAVSVTIGVSVMVGSFRNTVVTWLGETLQGDVYISVPGPTATTPSEPIDPSILPVVRNWPGVTRVDTIRAANIDSPLGTIQVSATDNYTVGDERVFLSLDVPSQQIWTRLMDGAVIVSEPLANRLSLPRHGAKITLFSDQGARQFPVIGIYYDYASTQGTVLMTSALYRKLWNDSDITAIALRLAPGTNVDRVVQGLQDRLAPTQRLVIQANQTLRREVLVIFDRTFAITGALQLLATVVAFIGVLSALLSLELDRQRELGILRAMGMTVRQLWASVLMETGLLGAAAGLLSMPTGYVLALILVFIINRRSFGWTLQMQVLPQPFLQALLVAVVAALLAGIYPALRMARMITSEALRSE